jgi:hypothetical protein
MASTRFYSTINRETQSSGISDIPKLFKYPQLLDFNIHRQRIKDHYCYTMPHYGYDGLSVLIYRQPKNDNIIIVCGDWNGNQIELIDVQDPCRLVKLASDFLINDAMKIYELLKLIRVEQAQLFMSVINDELVLVDMQVALYKFASPGMLRDIFGKIYRVPEMKCEIIDDRVLESIDKSSCSYNGNLIIKPNKFKLYEENNMYIPMYFEVVR